MGIFDGFMRKYHEGSAPVRDGLPSADEAEEIDYFPTSGGGDASGRMAYEPKERNKKYKGFRDTGKRLAPEAEDDSRRGAGGPGYPVDKSEPDDDMSPGWNGDALDGPARVRIACPHCDEPNTVRLPKHLTVTRAARTGEGDGGQGKVLRTKCGKCGETVRFHAPEGHKFSNRESAAASYFKSRYGYLTGRRSINPNVGRIRNAMESFRRSYWGR